MARLSLSLLVTMTTMVAVTRAGFRCTLGDWACSASESITDHDIDIVSTCSWIFPNARRADKMQKEEFRSPELSKIINYHKRMPQQIEAFERWRDEAVPDEEGK